MRSVVALAVSAWFAIWYPVAAGPVTIAAAAQAQPARTAADLAKLGPQVGDRVPDFSLPDQRGTARTLKSILGPNGAVLVFFRSADW